MFERSWKYRENKWHNLKFFSFEFPCNVIKSLRLVWLFGTPWTVVCQNSSVHGILQATILEWVAIPFSRGSSQPKDWTQVSYIAGGFFTSWATREAQNLQRWVLNDQRDRVSWIELFNGRDYVRNFYIAFPLSMVWHRAST